ncbi:MAG TPA: ABC transporter ATP-binding protein [Frankiaceae bacterium]|nr:ABC transporter ATP-binding protein [Frankiaceae bacterium]
MNTVNTQALGKRFKAKWALTDCSFELPEGKICGLVGSNGAGKTTLLRLIAGLAQPSSGTVQVFGQPPADTTEFLQDVGFLAQDVPLYKRWNSEDHLGLGAHLNPRWGDSLTRDRLRSLGIPLDQRVGTLSGGQRAQVALAMALGKRPRLLLLDEPVAALDPLARRDFLGVLAEAVAEGDLTVILSSHLVGDLERICDHLVLLDTGRLVLAADLDDVLASHRLLTGPRRNTFALERDHTVLQIERTQRQVSAWVRLDGPLHDPHWEVAELGLEDIALAYMSRNRTRPEQLAATEAIGAVR